MPIDASLFAHIENDSSLTGTYQLEGNKFVRTTEYLNEYLDQLDRLKEPFPPEYSTLLQQMKYLVQVERTMETIQSSARLTYDLNRLATTIAADLMKMPVGEKLLLPGGWYNSDGGHAMMYQLSLKGDGFDFTAVNPGAGSQYHAKKSAREKELHNPMKTWHFPRPTTTRASAELVSFIERLLKARLPFSTAYQTKPVTDKVLYEEILPSISYIGGEEINAGLTLPDYVYTGGQLSGTCTQRVIHQMLKILSNSSITYQRFIFKFKQYALFDYSESCFKGDQPFTAAVAAQIHLAIENNLKILNTSGLFNDSEIRKQASTLTTLQTKLSTVSFKKTKISTPIQEDLFSLKLSANTLAAPHVYLDREVFNETIPDPVDLREGTGLLANMSLAIRTIQGISDQATQYAYLEKLLLQLPLNPIFLKGTGFYREFTSLEDFRMFQKNLYDIQTMLLSLQKDWLNDQQNPSMNVLNLSVVNLQMDAYTIIPEGSKLPSFTPFSDAIMQSIVGNQERNPFIGTNHPALDQRILELQSRYKSSPVQSLDDYFEFFKRIVKTEEQLNGELKALYQHEFGQNTTELHDEIRKHGLESLFMITQHHNYFKRLESKFNPIIDKVEAHLAHENKVRKAINPFYVNKYTDQFNIAISHKSFRINTALFPSFVPYELLENTLPDSKYALKDSPARYALQEDTAVHSIYSELHTVKTANGIQLKPQKTSDSTQTNQRVTQADIVARDYLHLRSEPDLQIALTLDYFTRHIGTLSDESNQRYVEANLFQPGLLLNASNNLAFIPQFDLFLKTGHRFFTQNGQHTQNSILYLRLDYLVSRYLFLNKDPVGIIRLKAIQNELEKQLSLPNDPDVTYVLQQYLFLSLMTRMEMGEHSDELFTLAFNAYFYINSHTNPLILEDKVHRIEVDSAIAKFKIVTSKQPTPLMQRAIKKALIPYEQTTKQDLVISGTSPSYELEDRNSRKKYTFNVLGGKLFENGLARSGVPLVIQNHALIKRLGFQEVRECLMSTHETYMILSKQDEEVHLFYNNSKLIVQKDWTIRGSKNGYELQALTKDHLAQRANSDIIPITSSLPAILTDGSMDFWVNTNDPHEGILVQDNIPMYSFRHGKIWVLDPQGDETGYQLSALEDSPLKNFESTQFLQTHKGHSHSIVKLQRYNLNFNIKASGIINTETGEQVVDRPSPIHPAVAGLVMAKNTQERYLVPVARFYATEHGAERSDFYPVVHDISGTIATASLEEYWISHPPLNKPMWRYKNSEKSISFRLKDGEPIADNVADALYLVYIYLATNQTEKAWKTLEECSTRLGGLTGDPVELQFIAWICKDLPHLLPSAKSQYEQEKPSRKTPPYVACQLKAMSMLCDHLTQGRTFDLKLPHLQENTANSQYDSIQHDHLKNFLTALPATVYQSFSRLQSMRRHLEHTYTLSTLERKRLLGYYHQTQPKEHAPQGALGFEWMSLSLELLLEERDSLLARYVADKSLSPADQSRLDLIQSRLKKLKPVVAKSTSLERVAIDLSLPNDSKINRTHLKPKVIESLELWHHRLPGDPIDDAVLNRAINTLSSNISEDDFIANFPAYLQLALSRQGLPNVFSRVVGFITQQTDPKVAMRKTLIDFCTQTLIAKRHISLDKQDSNIPLLCNILYRVLRNIEAVDSIYGNIKFDELITRARALHGLPLMVYQAKDVYQGILATPDEVMAHQVRPKRTPLRTTKKPLASLIVQTGIDAQLIKDVSKPKEQLNRLIAEYNALQEQSDKELTALGRSLNDDIERTCTIEKQAGTIVFGLEQQKRVIADSLIQNPDLTNAILRATASADPLLKLHIKKSWLDALALANQGPDDPVRARTWNIEKQAKARSTLIKADLLSLYSHADIAFSIKKTGLSPENAQRLHDLIHNALVQGIQSQSIDKISSTLKKALSTGNANIAAQALDVLSRKEIPGLDEPSIVIIQHEENILLRKRQVSALKSLLLEPGDERRFKESIEKILPGGGKSKVIIPILAEKKAHGDNLVVVEVPKALLAINHVDLNSTSQRLFGKRAYRFEFNRDSDCSPERLEQIYQMFIEVMTTRSYLVTTGESIQSLELKYIELLFSKGEHDETWEKQIYWADKINNLFRHHTDCIIDEVHQGLSKKKKLNYTSGEPKPLSSSLIKNATALYNFITPEFIKEAPSFDESYDWTPFKTDLATKLITSSSSPLNAFVLQAVLRYGPGTQQELVAYLTNKAKKLPEALLNASPDDLASLAFFKQEINAKLPQTLTQQLDKHYGASKQEGLSSVETTLAIPYAASNVPNERNRFANEIESVNKTIQMMLVKGISKEQLIERITEWQAVARQELFQTKTITHIDDTSTAQGFALLTSGLGLKLSQVNSENSEQMMDLHGRLQFNRPLIFDFLREFSLKLIKQDSAIIPSDNFNHVSQYRSVQGISGTPPLNPMSYHQRLSYDKTASLGSDGYILEVIRNKKPLISSLDYEDVTQFTNAILGQSKSLARTRSIIDIKGTFTGVSNFDVAKKIASYIKTNPTHFNKPLKQVLYFNEAQILCAIDINKPDQPMMLGTSETSELNRLLDSTPGERFTYFDQIHTTGTDITQEENAHAVVLVDDKTLQQDFIQGSMRSRELEFGQTEELIVPTRLKDKTLEELYLIFEKNDQKNVVMEAPSAAKEQMKNQIRREFLSLIQDLPSEEAEKKAVLINHFKPFFEDSPSLDLFALYGGINKKQAIADILGHYQTQLKNLWETCLKNANLRALEGDIRRLTESLTGIIEKAIPFCLAEYDGFDDSFAVEVEVQKEVQKEVEIEVLSVNETYNASFKEARTRDWRGSPHFAQFFLTARYLGHMALTLNKVCERDSKEPSIFSNQLMASRNYAETYQEQTQYTGVFLKPVLLVWYHLHNDVLHAMIVTPQEAKQLEQCFKDLPSSWLSTTQDTLISGNRPDGVLLETRYQSLREQVRFFNGEFASLLNQETPLVWMKEDPVDKITFFENTLLPYRPGSAAELNQLRVALTQGKAEGFAYIAKHPFEDLTQFNWLSVFPKTIPAQAMEYKKIAETFVYLNKNWNKKTISFDDLQQEFRLPLNSLVYVNAHLNHLMELKKIQQRLKSSSPERPFLLSIPDKEITCIEECLGMPLSRFYELRGFTPPKPGIGSEQEQLKSWSIISIQVLNIVHSYPAFKDEPLFNAYFEVNAKQATSKEVLLVLLTTEKPTATLIRNILEHPLYDDSLMVSLFELRIDFTEDLLITLAGKCKTTVQIDLLLKRDNLTEKILHTLLGQSNLTDAHLMQILLHAKSDVTLELIGTHESANHSLREAILQHPLFSTKVLRAFLNKQPFTDDELLMVLKHPTAITTNVLKQILEKPSIGSKVLLALLLHDKTTYQLIGAIISHNAFSLDIAEKIIEREDIQPALLEHLALTAFFQHEKGNALEWEEYLNKVFEKSKKIDAREEMILIVLQKKEQISAPFGLKIFTQLGQDSLKHLPFSDMIKIANEEELGTFIDLELYVSASDLIGMAKRTTSKDQIDTLLARKEMTSEIADILFQKAEYSGKIGNWDWLTAGQLKFTLDKTRDYDSLYRALTHSNLSESDRQNWLEKKNEQQKENKAKVLTSNNPQQKLMLALNGLKIKAITHAIKASNNERYEEVARTAFGLYQTLHDAVELHLTNPSANSKQFKEHCQEAIDHAKPILQVHRGYKQVLLDVVNLLLAVFSLVKKGSWRFFETDTASMETVKKVKESIDENIQKEGEDNTPSV